MVRDPQKRAAAVGRRSGEVDEAANVHGLGALAGLIPVVEFSPHYSLRHTGVVRNSQRPTVQACRSVEANDEQEVVNGLGEMAVLVRSD